MLKNGGSLENNHDCLSNEERHGKNTLSLLTGAMDLVTIAITGLEVVVILAVIVSMVIIKKRQDRAREEQKLKSVEKIGQQKEDYTGNGCQDGFYNNTLSDSVLNTSLSNGTIREETREVKSTPNDFCILNGKFATVIERKEDAKIEEQEMGSLKIIRCKEVPQEQKPEKISIGDISFKEKDFLGNLAVCRSFKGKFQDNVDVAVKIVPFENESDRKFQENQVKKVKYDSENGSNNVIKYYSIERVSEGGELCLAMASELCPWNLPEFVQHEEMRSIPYTEACRQMITGLKYLHEIGVSHRSLMPSNIMVTGRESGYTFKLSDFGSVGRPKLFSKADGVSTENCSDGWVAPEVYDTASKSDWQSASLEYDPTADIFSMGMLCVYVKSKGKMLFENQEEIQRLDARFEVIEGDECLKQLIRQMTDVDTNKRPTCEECLKHPTFWDSVMVLDFLRSSTGIIQADDNLMEKLEKDAGEIVNYNWREHLTKGVEGYLFSPTRRRGSRALYSQDSVRLLLRAIRILREHFSELPMHVQVELGFYTEDYIKYWTDRFPLLLMHVYDTVKMNQKE